MKSLKKTLAVISSAVILCGGIAPSVASAEEYTIVEDKYTAEEALAAGYDFNLDGLFTYSDIYVFLQYHCTFIMSDETENVTSDFSTEVIEAIEKYGDVNEDGISDIVDAHIIFVNYNSAIQNGDVNEDGVLDLQDATTILRHYSYFSVGNKEYMNSQECMFVKNIGDINHDGSVNPVDATIILQTWALNSMQ